MSYDEDVWKIPPPVKSRDVRIFSGSSKKGSGARRSPLSVEAKARLGRIVNKAPEVMVKVTGRARGGSHLKQHLDYITRNGEIRAETQDGGLIQDRAEMRALKDDWLLANEVDARGRHLEKGAQAVAIVLSMPPGTPRDRVEDAARSWATETFKGTHDWVMVRHDDTDHPHCHVSVRAVGYDGRRLAPGPADLQTWRENFAGQLRRHGIEAEATPRQARGVTRGSDKRVIYQLENKGKTPVVRQVQQRDATTAARSSSRPKDPRWKTHIEARQDNIRNAYLTHAAELSQGDAADRQLGRDIERFVARLPVARTRREAMAEELRTVTKAHAGRGDVAPRSRIENKPPTPPITPPTQAPALKPKGPKR